MPDAPYILRGDEPPALYWHVGAVATAGLITVGVEAGRDTLSPTACRWCTTNGFDRSAQASLRWASPALADDLSDGMAFVAVPLVAGGAMLGLPAANGGSNEWFPNVLYVAEAVAITGALNQGVKLGVARQRPSTEGSSDDNLSFYSGHTALAFAAVASAGTVVELRGYRGAWAVWAVGIPMATFVGYLRVAGDKHWMSDVLVGAVVGGGTGVLVPLLLHPRVAAGAAGGSGVRSVSVSFVPGASPGMVVQGRF